jgi:hypothetical protein
MKKLIKECIIVAKKADDGIILAKNRDRAYSPKIEVVHEIINGVEMVYLRDTHTDWSEGMNEFGIGIVNTALMVGFDEFEKKIVKKNGAPAEDGRRIRKALTNKTLRDTIKSAALGGVKGHSFVADPLQMVTMETTKLHKPKITIVDIAKDDFVRTNHGFHYFDAGYTKGEDYKSSKIRKIGAEKAIEDAKSGLEIVNALKKQHYDKNSPMNMRRDTDKMYTSSQLMMNLSKREFHLHWFENKVDEWEGIKNRLPEGHEPKIKIIVKKFSI